MTTITAEQTVGELVASRPSRSRVFEAFHIDYCCGGKRSLREACHTKGIGVDRILEALVCVDANVSDPDEENCGAMPLDELTDHIVERHHAYLRRELPRLNQLAGKVLNAHGAKAPHLASLVETLHALTQELACHMKKEETILFPVIRQMAQSPGLPFMPFGSLANPINAMEAEHDEAGGGLGRMAELTDDFTPPDWACNTYRALLDGLHELEQDLHQHIHKENNILFPKAIGEEQHRRHATTNA